MQRFDLINKFIDFFQKNDHTFYSYGDIIPKDKNSTLFTVAGMQQFEHFFRNKNLIEHNAIITIQPCIRLSGKHNDLNEIGHTTRHNTFFEMMGNFSFYNYGKEKAIELAWTFLTKILQLKKEYLYVTIHHDDQEARKIWNKYISDDRIVNATDKTNFWSAGEEGLCGPSTEIFYDKFEDANDSSDIFRDHYEKDIDQRFLEIWNIVFISFDRKNGKLNKLDNICIDTGMGLERILSVYNKTFDNFDIDTLKINVDYLLNIGFEKIKARQISDHIRTIILLIYFGVMPGGKSRGSILRKLIRKVINSKKINTRTLVSNIYNIFQKQYNLKEDIKNKIEKIFEVERDLLQVIEEKVLKYCKKNMSEKYIAKLYDTHGIPVDVTLQWITDNDDNNRFINLTQINNYLDEFKKLSNLEINVPKDMVDTIRVEDHIYSINNARIIGIIHKETNIPVKMLNNEEGYIITNRTCFYPESGGQIGDIGFLNDHTVFDTIYANKKNKIILHYVKNGLFQINDAVEMFIDDAHRLGCARSHSATHILADFIKEKWNGKQMGSKVKKNEFTYDTDVNIRPYKEFMEYHVNDVINKCVNRTITINSKLDKGRTIQFGEYSKQLCGGTHVNNTSEIKEFKIISIKKISQFVFRIKAKVYDVKEKKNTKEDNNDMIQVFIETNNIIGFRYEGHKKKSFFQNIKKYEKKYRVVGGIYNYEDNMHIYISGVPSILVLDKIKKYNFHGNIENMRINIGGIAHEQDIITMDIIEIMNNVSESIRCK